MRYLNFSKNYSISYGIGDIYPIGFADSDFAGDRITAKSTYGYLFKITGGPVSWKAKRGTTICLSTLEAEYTALTEATREIEWLRNLFFEINIPIKTPTLLFGDNLGAISKTIDPVLHNRTKHTLIKFLYVKEKVEQGLIVVEYLETSKMPADGLTKALSPPKHLKFLDLIGLRNLKVE